MGTEFGIEDRDGGNLCFRSHLQRECRDFWESEYEEFLASFEHEKYQALRLNPLKRMTCLS